MVKTASVFSRLETMECLSGKRRGFTDKLLKINNLSGRRRGLTDESRNRWSSYPFCNKSFQEECQEVGECIEHTVKTDILIT